MSLTRTLAEKLASAPTATSLSGLSMLWRNSAGEFAVYNPYNPTIVISDLDACKTPGTYVYGFGTGNLIPGQGNAWNYGIIEVFMRYSTLFQRITSTNLQIAIRKFADGNWSDWKIVVS